MRFSKYQALGNDYLVIGETEIGGDVSPELIRRITHRNLGVGADGILVGRQLGPQRFQLRIFNPDGGQAEKSGNGLRIYARALFDSGAVSEQPFEVETLGGTVRCEIVESGARVRVAMGRVVFDSAAIPVAGEPREVLMESIRVGGREFEFSAASVGNPHCVIFVPDPKESETKELGPAIERDARFPNRSNVQFAAVQDRKKLRIEIWERGAGYTMASGTSACAAAGVALRLGLCDPKLTVQMVGGDLDLEFDDDFHVLIEGPVTHVATGQISDETLREATSRG